MPIHTGGCLCGAVRYIADAEPKASYACHCRDCQYLSGGAEANFVAFPRDGFALTQGKPAVYRSKADSGLQVWRTFCPVCGTPLYAGAEREPETIFALVGSLDEPENYRPEKHIWMASAPPWHLIAPGVPTTEGEH